MNMPQFLPPIRSGSNRDGLAWRVEDVNKWIIAGGQSWSILTARSSQKRFKNNDKEFVIMSDVDDAYKESTEVITKAKEAYDKILGSFRSTIKNDLSSISSSSDKVIKEVIKMNDSYNKAIHTLTSPEMSQAIANAEKLASALAIISSIQAANISFTLLDK